jgi:aryl-alcohol dehydrogenase-like predicted oxidoreductase
MTLFSRFWHRKRDYASGRAGLSERRVVTRTITLPGVPVAASGISLGTAYFGTVITRDEAFALLDAYAARGGNFVDTARGYAEWLSMPGSRGASERTIGAWLKSRGVRQTMVIATKGGCPAASDPARTRLDPEAIASDVADSLNQLDIDVIDLYWLHRDDPAVPVDEILDALVPHITSGRVRAIGASCWRPARLRVARERAEARGLSGFCASQVGWSLRHAGATPPRANETLALDDEGVGYHRDSGLRLVAHSSQAGGFFAKPLPPGTSAIDAARWHRAAGLARQRGATPNAVALAYVLDHPIGGCGIIGPRTLDQLHDSLDAASVPLTRDEIAWLETGL